VSDVYDVMNRAYESRASRVKEIGTRNASATQTCESVCPFAVPPWQPVRYTTRGWARAYAFYQAVIRARNLALPLPKNVRSWPVARRRG